LALDNGARQGVVIAHGPEGVHKAGQIGGRKAGEALATFRRVLTKAIKIGGVLQIAGKRLGFDLDFDRVAGYVRTRPGRRLGTAEQAKKQSARAWPARLVAASTIPTITATRTGILNQLLRITPISKQSAQTVLNI
jgi:hypothetical protein